MTTDSEFATAISIIRSAAEIEGDLPVMGDIIDELCRLALRNAFAYAEKASSILAAVETVKMWKRERDASGSGPSAPAA